MRRLDAVLKIEFVYMLLLAIALFCYALFTDDVQGEAYIGSFDVEELTDGWTLTEPDGTVTEDVSLPVRRNGAEGDEFILTNTLPEGVREGTTISMRATRQTIRILVNGEDRGLYRAVNFNGVREAVVSGYAIADLKDGDGGGQIKIIVTARRTETQIFNPLIYGYGNNVWFPYIKQNIFLVIIASALVFAGTVAIVTYAFIRRKINSAEAILYLAFVMIVDGLWIISESPIRQIIFKSPSYSSVFAFLLVESLAGFGAMYFNEIQEHRYEKIYVPLEAIIFTQVLINTVLHFTGTVEYYITLKFAHIWTIITILAGLICMVIDIRKNLIKRYSIVAFGMLVLIVSAAFELIVFYVGTFKLGVFLGLGLMILLATTAMQTIKDAIARVEDRRLYSEKMTQATFQTIAGTIDAKDEYTGGHSERVGEYAAKIATWMAETYSFTDDDIARIRQIGLMHDIGKIGVPDSVLNKKGRLTDEEYNLMKQHTVIGSDILKNIENVAGLRDGVRHHHERYDGKGYPDGLKGDEITPFARILCIADSFDAMTSDRVYRGRLTREQVLDEIEKNRGTQFSPEVADTVLAMIKDGLLEC
ncbi:HD domain-containing protein [Lachnospiraceae bacterium G11]|nr:HD domain-containing protein [Lachnospiraceae bacterium G11]